MKPGPVALFATCLVDQLQPQIGVATTQVLRRAGCSVSFDPRQTCCGQPAFNTGYRQQATAVARYFLDIYESAPAIVMPSGSCVAMVQHMASLFEPDSADHRRACAVAARCHELCAFLVRELGIDDLGARMPARVTWHDACHGLRDLGLHQEPRRLLAKVRDLVLVEAKHANACCGFGGTFAVKYPELSTAIADTKLAEIEQLDVDAVVASDASCLLQLGGRLTHQGSRVRTLHIAEVLAAT